MFVDLLDILKPLIHPEVICKSNTLRYRARSNIGISYYDKIVKVTVFGRSQEVKLVLQALLGSFVDFWDILNPFLQENAV